MIRSKFPLSSWLIDKESSSMNIHNGDPPKLSHSQRKVNFAWGEVTAASLHVEMRGFYSSPYNHFTKEWARGQRWPMGRQRRCLSFANCWARRVKSFEKWFIFSFGNRTIQVTFQRAAIQLGRTEQWGSPVCSQVPQVPPATGACSRFTCWVVDELKCFRSLWKFVRVILNWPL